MNFLQVRDRVEETKVQKREKSLEMKVGRRDVNKISFSQISSFRTIFLSLMTRKTSWRRSRRIW